MEEERFKILKIISLIVMVIAFTLFLIAFGRKWEVKGDSIFAYHTDDLPENIAVTDEAGKLFDVYYQFDTDVKEAYVVGITSDVNAVNQTSTTDDVVIPANIIVDNDFYDVVAINNNAFENYIYLRTIQIGGNVKSIGNAAFRYCTNLTSVTGIEGGQLTTIGTEAFYGCTSLNKFGSSGNSEGDIFIPYSVTSIGSGAFANCPDLKRYQVYNNASYTTLEASGGILYAIESSNSYRLVSCPSGYAATAVEIPNTVFAIDSEAFAYCRNIRTIVIPDSVETIRERAFYSCYSLNTVTMPRYATILGEDIFGECSSLAKVIVYNEETGNVYSYCQAYAYPLEVHYTVRFYNDGELISTQDIISGKAATAPTLSLKNGQTYKWDTDFSKVTTNLTVTAVWLQNYKVVFQDLPNGWVSEVTASYGQTVTPPAWTKDGYSLAWDSDAYLYVSKDLTINAVWLQSLTGGSVTTGTSDGTYSVGDSFTIGDLTYKVTKRSDSNNRVQVIAARDKSATYIKIPSRITAGGTVFKVTNIAARVFKNMTALKKVVIGSNMLKINTAAFYGCSNLKNIVIYSNKLTGDNIGDNSFKGVYSTVKVKVPKGYVAKYKIRLRDGGLPSTAKVVGF